MIQFSFAVQHCLGLSEEIRVHKICVNFLQVYFIDEYDEVSKSNA